MTPHILEWLDQVAKPLIPAGSRVAEIGALNVNGSARDVLGAHCGEWIGWDVTPGPGVDRVGRFDPTLEGEFDLVISCEAYEHDKRFWQTDSLVREHLRQGKQTGRAGLYLITVPGLTVPYHSYGGDFYRFTTDAFHQVFFADLHILALSGVGPAPHQNICGIAALKD
jgi:hypothetical protein